MNQSVTPEGFAQLSSRQATLVVGEDYRPEVEQLGLLESQGLDRWLASDAARPRSGGRAGSFVVTLPESGRRLHLRPFAHGGVLRWVTGRRLLGLARPIAELAAAQELRARGVSVPEPVLVLGTRQGPFWHAYVGSSFVDDAVSGGDLLRSDAAAGVVLALAKRAGASIRQFHDAGGRHPDLHVDNLLVVGGGSRTAAVMVTDLDRVAVGDPPAASARIRELMRLRRSLEKRSLLQRVGSVGEAAFFEAYVAGDEVLRASLVALLPREQRRNSVHRLGY